MIDKILNILVEFLFIGGMVLFVLGQSWDGEILMLSSIYLLLHKK